MPPIWTAWAAQHGPNAVNMLKEIREVLKK
jgi:hypothetical protein